MEVEGLEGGAAVRLGPAGLRFELPATLVVTPAPPGDQLVGLHFEEGATTGTLLGAAPEGAGRSLPIAHFSGGVLATPEQLRDFLSTDDRIVTDALENALEDEALGLADRLALVVQPAVAAATKSVAQLKVASVTFASWAVAVQSAGIEEEAIVPRGSESFGAANARLQQALRLQAEALQKEFERPRCSDPGGEAEDPDDWLRLREEIFSVVSLYGGEGLGTPCTHAELVLSGTQTLTSTDDEVVLDAHFALVGPAGERLRDGPVTVSFASEGATGPAAEQTRSGALTGLRFARPAAPRPPVVRVTATVDLADYEFPTLDVAPVVWVASEPLGATVSVTPASIGPGETALVCARGFASGQPIPRFNATFSAMGTGFLSSREAVGIDGEVCVNYQALASSEAETVQISVDVEVTGAVAVATTSFEVTPSAVRVTVTAPATSVMVGASIPFAASVTGASDPAVTWSASGGDRDLRRCLHRVRLGQLRRDRHQRGGSPRQWAAHRACDLHVPQRCGGR